MRTLVLAGLLAFAFAAARAAAAPPLWPLQLEAHNYELARNELRVAEVGLAHGGISEYDALEAFRPLLLGDDAKLSAALDDWVKARPNDYISWLARGVYLRKRGEMRRGSAFASDVPDSDMAAMHRLFERARADLQHALEMKADSYFALLSLMAIAQYEDDDALATRVIAAATRIVPDGLLVRGRYMTHLSPRWGGSIERMRRFVEDTRASGAPKPVVDAMDAMLWDNIGLDKATHGDEAGARAAYARALGLGDVSHADPRFINDYLPHALSPCLAQCRQ